MQFVAAKYLDERDKVEFEIQDSTYADDTFVFTATKIEPATNGRHRRQDYGTIDGDADARSHAAESRKQDSGNGIPSGGHGTKRLRPVTTALE